MTSTFATNSAANSAVSYLHRNSDMQGSSISKLSSGSRIVKASDDAASLAVGTKLKADVTALKQASTNADQAASLLQIADGALSRVGDTLMRMKSLATQARSDVLSGTERGYLNEEFQEMTSQIDYITSSTKFNGRTIVDGSMGAEVKYGGNALWNAADEFSAMAGGNFDGAGTETPIISTLDGQSVAPDTDFQLDYDDGADAFVLTNTNTGNHEQITSGGWTQATGQTFSLDFEDHGVRISMQNLDLSGGADISDSFSYANQPSLSMDVETGVKTGDYFAVTYDQGTTSLTVEHFNKDDVSQGSQVKNITETDGDQVVDFDSLGVKLNIDNFDTGAYGTLDGFDGTAPFRATMEQGAATFQVGVTAESDDINVSIQSATADALDVSGTNINTISAASTANSKIDGAVEVVNQQRANLGANMSRIEKINENLATTTENLDAARSTLMDVDVAEEMTKFSTNQVMTQAATAMLAQANQLPQNLMKLLQ
jgi:flagellin